jgi:peptide/nickel transport system permease protein
MRYLRRNPTLPIGLAMLLFLVLFTGIGSFAYQRDGKSADELARPLSAPPGRPPSWADPLMSGTDTWKYPLGTDNQGRDLMAVMIVGTPLTVRTGFLAGFIGLFIGTVLAFLSAYYGGWFDATIRGIVDIGLTIPNLVILILVAVAFKGGLTVDQMALIVGLLAWVGPTRTIRSQVLTLRERAYVQVARLSGMGSLKIIFFELLPNLLPYLAASLVGAMTAAIFAVASLEALGLGPIDSPTLGMTIYWVIYYSALLHGMWWWFGPPIAIIILLFVGLFNVSAGLDEIANPRLRRAV